MDKLASLGINPWSMLLYLINTGILLAILTYFLYKPIMKFVDERKKQIEDSISESKKLKESFEEELKKKEAEQKKMEATLRTELDNLHKFTEKKRAELNTEMEEKRSSMVEKAQAEIDQKKAQLIKDVEEEIKKIMTRIILEIVENKVPENVIQESITSSWKAYSK